uniref:Uncharacterized protein n=1 Tax=Clastoptera arizonana TaxID=38151 RepID=A0A1B6DNE2_9HEMI
MDNVYSRFVKDILKEEVKQNDFKPREYQIELLELALKQNTIMYLPTGSGKTFIATLLIKELSKQQNCFEKSFSEGGKLSFFLVNTVPLVTQQSQSIRTSTPFSVGAYSGDMGVDFWDKETWVEQFDHCQVLVMTCQIFLNLLTSNVLKLNQVNLIIFDECHHSVNNHPMRQIMKMFQNTPKEEHPRILGLTATLLNGNIKVENLEEEIHKLEITLQSKIATATNESLVQLYSTNPVETTVDYFANKVDSGPYVVCSDIIRETIKNFQTVDFEVENLDSASLAPSETIPLQDLRKYNKRIANILSDVEYNLKELGLYGGSKAAVAHMIQTERLILSADILRLKQSYIAMNTCLITVRKVLEISMASEKNPILSYSSPKVLKLLEILADYKESDTAIIFVQRRFTAKVLYYIFKDLKTMDKRYQNIKPDFIVGFNANPFKDTREGHLKKKWNREVLNKFSGGEVNVLFASDVIEEGTDLQLCNLVIKFDKPLDFRSYVQSKGRARNRKSKFFLFRCIDDDKFNPNHGKFKSIESTLVDLLGAGKSLDRNEPGDVEIQKHLYNTSVQGLEPFMPQGPSGPQISNIAAISVVNQYCALLGSDKFTNVGPYYGITMNKSDGKCIAHLILPTESKARGIIYGKPMTNKNYAKQSVALETCKLLYERGELNPLTLLPMGQKAQLIEEINLCPNYKSQDQCDASEIYSSKMKKYSKYWPQCLSECRPRPNMCLYIHVIKMDPCYPEPKDSRRKHFYNLLKSDQEFGILSSKPLPKVCEFPLYLNVGDLRGRIISCASTVQLTDREIDALINFHSVIFTRILDLVKPFLMRDYFDRENSFLIVPLKQETYEIDFDTVLRNQQVLDVIEPSTEEKLNLNVTEESHLDAVVCPYYRSMHTYTNYIVTRICYELDEHSPFPADDFDSYADYFIRKYEKTLYSSNQPLLEVRAISTKINCLKPRSITKPRRKKRDNEDDDFEETLVPELCVKFDFPSVFWLKATVLPTILHRLNQLCIAEELRVKIANEIKVGQVDLPQDCDWEPISLDRSTIKEEQSNVPELVPMFLAPRPKKIQHYYDILWGNEQEPLDLDRNMEEVNQLNILAYEHFINKKITETVEQKPVPGDLNTIIFVAPPELEILKAVPEGHIGPQLSEVMQALTSASSNDIVNYERLETLGDCFLKFVISLSLYLNLPDLNEGILTQLKGQVVGNKNLFLCGKKLGIGSMIKTLEFSPKDDWLPPGFCVHPEVQKIINTAMLAPTILFHLTIPPNERDSGKLSDDTLQEMMEKLMERGEDDDLTCSTNTNFVSTQLVADKKISDVVESLIGVYLKSCGVKGALKAINWMGIMRSSFLTDEIFSPYSPPVLLGRGNVFMHLISPNKLESILGYKFNDKAFMLHALTHPTYSPNTLTKSYQRLEFLGDAVIDFLVTCHIYEKCGNLTPGELTDLRSALVNNITLACLTVRYGFHKFLLARSCTLDKAMNEFVIHQEANKHVVDDNILFLRSEIEVEYAESVDIPKVLGDVFESLIGAIYLDSGKDMNVTWKILYNLMKDEIAKFSARVPKNHVRQLYESDVTIKFLPSEVVSENNYTMVPLEIFHDGKYTTFVGFGENKKKAKRAAAKLALRHIYEVD